MGFEGAYGRAVIVKEGHAKTVPGSVIGSLMRQAPASVLRGAEREEPPIGERLALSVLRRVGDVDFYTIRGSQEVPLIRGDCRSGPARASL